MFLLNICKCLSKFLLGLSSKHRQCLPRNHGLRCPQEEHAISRQLSCYVRIMNLWSKRLFTYTWPSSIRRKINYIMSDNTCLAIDNVRITPNKCLFKRCFTRFKVGFNVHTYFNINGYRSKHMYSKHENERRFSYNGEFFMKRNKTSSSWFKMITPTVQCFKDAFICTAGVVNVFLIMLQHCWELTSDIFNCQLPTTLWTINEGKEYQNQKSYFQSDQKYHTCKF